MITIIDIGPNALAAILAIVGLLTSVVALLRVERMEVMHTTMQARVTRNETRIEAAENGHEKKEVA